MSENVGSRALCTSCALSVLGCLLAGRRHYPLCTVGGRSQGAAKQRKEAGRYLAVRKGPRNSKS